MQGAEWARLSHPFPPEAFGWQVVEFSADKTQARLAPYLRTAAIRARFDEVAGLAGWSFQLAPLGENALVCNLTIAGVSRAALVAARLPRVGADRAGMILDLGALGELALSDCAKLFGVPVPVAADGGWVDYDEAAQEPFYTPLLVDDKVVGPAPADAVAPAAEAAVVAQRPDGQLAIDRLLERLKAEGLGKEAAKLVVTYHGYGRTPEEARELYGKLRGLLLEKQEATP